MPVWSNNSNMTSWQQVHNTFKQVSMPVWGCVRRCQAGPVPGRSGGKVATWTSYNNKSDRTSLPFLFSSYSLTPPNWLLNLLLLYQKKKKNQEPNTNMRTTFLTLAYLALFCQAMSPARPRGHGQPKSPPDIPDLLCCSKVPSCNNEPKVSSLPLSLPLCLSLLRWTMS